MTYDELVELSEKLEAHLRENRLFASVFAMHEYIVIEIHWGDWKHEHLRCKWLTEEFFGKLGKTVSIQTDVTEEDGSDCYSANHFVFVS